MNRDAIDRRSLALLLIAATTAAGCDGPPTPDASQPDSGRDVAVWTCPVGWVASSVGGCGPAILLCEADGGAAPGACDGVDIRAPRTFDDPDTGSTIAMHRAADGGFAGAWHEEDDPDGYPAADWTPDAGNGTSGDTWSPTAGIPSCPSGWSRRSADGTCDPIVRGDCPTGSEPLPAGTCTTTDATTCPAARWPDPGPDAIGATVVRVAAGSDATLADGSMTHPYATLGAAIMAAGSGGYILVAAGRYDEALRIDASVHLVGACAARVVVAAPSASDALIVTGSAVDVMVRGVGFTGTARGIVAELGARVRVEACVANQLVGAGIAATTGARIDARDLAVTDVTTATGSTAGPAISVIGGATFDGTRISIRAATESALVVEEPFSSLHLTDSVVQSTRLGDSSQQAAAVARNGAAITLERVVVDRNPVVALRATDSTIAVTDTVVRTTTATDREATALSAQRSDLRAERLHVVDVAGNGIESLASHSEIVDSMVERAMFGTDASASGVGVVGIGGHVHLARSIVRDTHSAGAFLGHSGSAATSTSAEIEDCRFDATGAVPLDPLAIGIGSQGIRTLSIRNTLVAEQVAAGVALNTRSDADIERLVLRGTGRVDRLSVGLSISYESTARVRDLRITGATGFGSIVESRGARLDLDHAMLDHFGAMLVDGNAVSVGILVLDGAMATVRHTRIDDVPVLGVAASETGPPLGTSCELYDSAVLHVTPSTLSEVHRNFASALGAGPGATLTVARTRIESNAPVGGYAGRDATLSIRDSIVRDTRSLDDGFAAAALFAFEGGNVDATRVVVEDAHNTGAIAWGAGYLHLADSIISRVAPDRYGFGTGVNASGDGIVEIERVAIVDTHGAALMATPFQDPLVPRTTGARLFARDLYAATVRPSTIRIEYDDLGVPSPSGAPVAYALHAGAMCTVDVERGVLRDAEYGFYASSGPLALRDVVVASMSQNAGAQSGVVPDLARVWFVSNRSDDILTSTDLPEGAMLRTPEPSCANPACL